MLQGFILYMIGYVATLTIMIFICRGKDTFSLAGILLSKPIVKIAALVYHYMHFFYIHFLVFHRITLIPI